MLVDGKHYTTIWLDDDGVTVKVWQTPCVRVLSARARLLLAAHDCPSFRRACTWAGILTVSVWYARRSSTSERFPTASS
jgi:hypothetical protein